MPPVTIPEEFNSLSMAEAFRFYRDAGLHVYPVHPPWAKVGFPGKQPAVKQWWDFDPQDCDIAKYFDNGRPYNIGVAPKNGLLLLDLDSKADQGASVRSYLDQADEQLRNVPRHLTSGGAHLAMFCPDLPPWKNPKNGQPIQKPLSAKLNDKVSAELYHCERSNVVLPPSIHPSGFRYTWTLFGLLPEYIWRLIQRMIPFEEPFAEEPKKRGKPKAWYTKFRGDLSSLDLIGLLASLGHGAELDDADEGRYTVKCPWRYTDHSDPADETGAKVWQSPDAAPQFYCHHNCCRSTDRGLKEVLEWAEEKSPGIVDKFCALERVWRAGQKSRQGLPRILHAVGRLESTVYSEVGAILGPHHAWYVRGSSINIIEQIPSGFVYSEDPSERYKIAAHSVGFRELSSLQAKGSLEEFMEPGVLVEDSSGTKVFVPKSFSTDFCAGMLVNDRLKEKLPHIARILTVPLPFRVGQKSVYPKKGYDPRFATYLMPDAPELFWMPIEEARATIDSILTGFCFTSDQSKTHAIARILTPFGRGILGWTTRVPLWFFWANRPRAGKDYLAAVALLIYEGASFEDLPIGKDSEETAKRIMSAARNGRRFMHFSNCQAYLQDEYLIQALTCPVIAGRRLGSNEATSDLSVPNEMEFSLSGNIGLDFREDLEPRMRKIELAFFEEDANSRVFPDKFLHRTIKNSRAKILSAIAAIYREFAQAGFPEGSTPFSTYPEWGSLVGGVMQASGYGDPCQPFKGKFADSAGDDKSRAMAELFKACFEEFPGQKVKKTGLYRHVHIGGAENDALGWFCPLEQMTVETNRDQIHKNRIKLGKLLLEYEDRVLNEIKLIIDKSSGHPSRYTYQFVFERNAPMLENVVFAPNSCQSVSLKKGTDRGTDTLADPLPEPLDGRSCQSVSQNPTYAYAREKILIDTRCIKEDLFPIYGVNPPETDNTDRLTGCFLALDLETCAEVKVSRRGKPTITATKEALSPWKGEIRLLTLADGAGNIQSFDLRTDTLPDEIRGALERCPLIVHNAAFDLLFLKVRLGLQPSDVFCSMTAARLLTPSRSVSHSLGATLERYLGVKVTKEHGRSDWGALVLTDSQIAYAHDDVRHLHRLEATLRAELARLQLEKVFALEMRLISVVVGMEAHGFAIDRARLDALRADAADNEARLTLEARQAFDLPALNLNSPPQLLEAFKAAGADIEATDEPTLKACADKRAGLVLDYRAHAKLGATIKGLRKALGADGRIHAQFSPTGALSGRFTSKGPNLQNITRGALRSCFVPSSPDRSLIVADYSQIELRIGAYFANDQVMLKAFRAKEDLHRATAAAVLSKPLAEVTKADRQLAKAVNFGFLYGQAAKGFREYARTNYDIVLSLEEATRLRDKFFDRYRGLGGWHQDAWTRAQKGVSEARTIFGRLSLEQGDEDWDRFQLHTSYRVSGSAADVLKLSMVKAMAALPSDVHMVATVHDELVFDSPSAQASQHKETIRALMEEAFAELFGPELPIEVEVKVCANWGEK
jgi:DNA polymerase I-like protein with 3'-5' exonuclease and polymerase domains